MGLHVGTLVVGLCLLSVTASAATSVVPAGPGAQGSWAVAVAPGSFRFATACTVDNCAQCSFTSAKECARCEDGFFAFKPSYDALSNAPLCLDCAPLGCGGGGCLDGQGCSACANGSVLTVDVEARSTRRGAVVYSAQPARCQRCAADLGCAGCEDWAGCTSCPAGSIRTGTTGTANYTRCVACKSLGCASCEDGVGCTVCPPGSFLFSSLGADGNVGDGLARCRSCTELNCGAGWCVDNQGCSSCPADYVLSQNLTAVPLPPLRCLSCSKDLQCLECSGQLGCRSCRAGMYLKAVTSGDLYPRTECANCTELGCATCNATQGCLTCPAGSFLDTSATPATCRECSDTLNCAVCGSSGCQSCPVGSYLTDSLVYPGKKECARCQGCASCSAEGGCDGCMLGYFLVRSSSSSSSGSARTVGAGIEAAGAVTPAAGSAAAGAGVGSCTSCAAHNCATCADNVGCTSCLEGTYMVNDTDLGVMSCHSCADELNCALCGEGGCRTCPLGYYRCRQVVNGQAVTGCCPCQGCAKCQDFRGCTACPYNFTLTELADNDPANTCEDSKVAGNCTITFSCLPCDSTSASGASAVVGISSAGSATPGVMAAAVFSGAQAATPVGTGGGSKPAPTCNTCPPGQFLADPTAPFLDCRDCTTWLGCEACGMAGCTSCPSGAYLTVTSFAGGLNITSCAQCSSCTADACADHYGCVRCPKAFSARFGAAPSRRCYDCGVEGLNCAKCADDTGCTACPYGYFLDRPAADSPFYCAPCQLVLGCSACDADKGCASCPAGYGLARMGAHWNAGVASCVKTGIKAPAAAAAAANATR